MTELWVERTGIRRYTGRSSRGAEVLIGSVTDEGVFTPGELMKIALAGCSGLSSDQPLRRRLGDDYPAVIRVSGDADRDDERYPRLQETLEIDLSGLSAADQERLLLVVSRADRPGLHRRAHAQDRHRDHLRRRRHGRGHP